jgi:DNA-binding transcriptional LysR family regulator
MDTEFHKTFVIVVEGGSIAEAARCLNLTPASVALRMRTLEKEFGARLLVRSGWTVTPTEAGRALTELGRNLRWLGISFAPAHETAEGNR